MATKGQLDKRLKSSIFDKGKQTILAYIWNIYAIKQEVCVNTYVGGNLNKIENK